MSEEPFQLEGYPMRSLAAAEEALFAAWEGLEKFRQDLVVVGGLAVHYHTRDAVDPVFPSTTTLDVDFGISLGADAGLAGTALWDLQALGYARTEDKRMSREMGHGKLYIDFLTEHPPSEQGTRNVSDVIASVCPGINRALASRKEVEIAGTDQSGDKTTFQIPICGIGPLLVLKLNAFVKRLNTKRAKDAYDSLVSVSSYSEGPEAAIAAFHEEAHSENVAFAPAVQALKEHFVSADLDGPRLAKQFCYGHIEPGEEGKRLQEDLVTIAHALLEFS